MKKKLFEELTNETTENYDQEFIRSEALSNAKESQLEQKILAAVGKSAIPYFGISLLLGILARESMLSQEVASLVTTPGMVIGSSLILGAAMEWKREMHHALKSFLKKKTQSEQVEDVAAKEIELEKVQNRQNVVKKICEIKNSGKIEWEESFAQSLEESQERVMVLAEQLNQKYLELDVLSTQKVLSCDFCNVRKNIFTILNTAWASVLGGCSVFGYSNVPLMIVRGVEKYNTLPVNASELVVPFAIGAIGAGSYMIKRNADHRKAFQSLNETLQKDSLGKIASGEKEKIRSDIDAKTQEIAVTYLLLHSEKNRFEMFQKEREQKEETLEFIKRNSFSKTFFPECEKTAEENTNMSLERKF